MRRLCVLALMPLAVGAFLALPSTVSQGRIRSGNPRSSPKPIGRAAHPCRLGTRLMRKHATCMTYDRTAWEAGYESAAREIDGKRCACDQGSLPSDLVGTYFRNGPALFGQADGSQV
jgi:hypothetical protein